MLDPEALARDSLARFAAHHAIDDLVVSSEPFGNLIHAGGAPFGSIHRCAAPEWQDTAYGILGCVKGLAWALAEIDRLRAAAMDSNQALARNSEE